MDSAGETNLNYISRIGCFATPLQLSDAELLNKSMVRSAVKPIFDVGGNGLKIIKDGSRISVYVMNQTMEVSNKSIEGITDTCFVLPSKKAVKPKSK